MLPRGMVISIVSNDQEGWVVIVSPKERESKFNGRIYRPTIHSFFGDMNLGKQQHVKDLEPACLKVRNWPLNSTRLGNLSLPILHHPSSLSQTQPCFGTVSWYSPNLLYHSLLIEVGQSVQELAQFPQPWCKCKKPGTQNRAVFLELLSRSELAQCNGGLLWSWDALGTPPGRAHQECPTTKTSSAFRMQQQTEQAPIADEAAGLQRRAR